MKHPLRRHRLPSIANALVLLSASCVSHAQTSPNTEVLGIKVQHFLRSSYFLEAASSGECRPFVQRAHAVENDLQNILENVPPEGKQYLKPGSDLVSATKAQAYQELERMRGEVKAGVNGLEFRCGVLLGIASTVYYQSRSSWSEATRQSKPVWVLP